MATLIPTNRKETATADNVDFGKVAFPVGFSFEGNTAIETLPPLTKENLSQSTSWDRLFCGCTKLKSITLPDKEGITRLERAFENCTGLERAVLPSNLDKCTDITRLFAECVNLKTAVIPNLQAVQGCYSVVYDCKSLTTLTVGDINPTGKKVNISWFCYNCVSVTKAQFGDLGNVTIGNGDYTFDMKNCTDFSIKKLPMCNIPAMTGFSKMTKLTPQSYANIFAALPYNTTSEELNIYLNSTSLNAAKATTGKYTATDVYDISTKKELSKSLTINEWITIATNKGWIINT